METGKKTLHVLGLSGGKDSAALAMYMRKNYPQLDMHYYFTDTGKELPEVVDFVNRLEGYVGTIIDPYDEVYSSNREKKDFDYYLKKHQNYLPSPQARWCTIQMKLVPYEQWVNKKLKDEGYEEVISYVGIRADEPERTGFLTNSISENYMTIKMPFREDGIDRKGVFEILKKADLYSDHPDVISYRDVVCPLNDALDLLFENIVKFQATGFKEQIDSRKLFTDFEKVIEDNNSFSTLSQFLNKLGILIAHPDAITILENTIELFSKRNAFFNNLVEEKSKNPDYKGNVDAKTLRKIVEAMVEGKPGYYGWRSRSGCTFCFYQQKIEWLRLKEIYPEAFEEAKKYEKAAEDEREDGTFYWLGKDTPLSSLESIERKEQTEANHKKKFERFLKKKARRRNQLQIAVKVVDTDVMDEIYDEAEGGGACVTCYK